MPTARSARAWRLLVAVSAAALAVACSQPRPSASPAASDPEGTARNVPEIPAGSSGGAQGSATPTRETRETDPAAFQACVDRELSRRGLNSFGDPPGTPPRDVGDRHEYVTKRYPDIRTACSTPSW